MQSSLGMPLRDNVAPEDANHDRLVSSPSVHNRGEDGSFHHCVRSVLQMIHQRYSDPAFGLGPAATELQLSTRHISRLLQKHTGASFSWHLRTARLNAARRLLASDDRLLIKEVAYAVGYSINELERTFRLFETSTPSAYRSRRRYLRNRK